MGSELTVFGLLEEDSQTTESLLVASKFGKRHSDMIRSIEKQILPNVSKVFAERNITLCFKNNDLQNGKPQKYYQLTKDGFMMVGMSLTGKEAYQWKEAFIEEFNRLEEENRIMRDIVWKTIEGKAFLGQEMGCKCAGIDQPRLFIKYLKENGQCMEWMRKREYFSYRRVGKNPSDMAWTWSKEGFKWLIKSKARLNLRTAQIKENK